MAKMHIDTDNVELKVPCKPEYVRTVRALIEDLADAVPLSPQAIEEVKVAASEAVANIVRHAYHGSVATEPVLVRCSTGCGMLTVEIIDRGVGFKVPAAGVVPQPDTSKEGGLGIILIRSLMDKVDYWSQPNLGTRIKMTKHGWRGDGKARVCRNTPQAVGY
jgi:serine/threonine-protein kinase RsbW